MSEQIYFCTVEPRQYNEGRRDWQNLSAITRFCYIEVHFQIFYYYWGKEDHSLYRELRYIEVRYRGIRYIEVCYIEDFVTLYRGSLHRGLRYIEVRYTEDFVI